MNEIKSGDIVQIVDEQHPWFPCLLIVGEVKTWGVQAAVVMPTNNTPGSGTCSQAWNRIKFEAVEKVGEARVVLHDPAEED